MGPEASNNQVIEDSFKVKVTDGTHNRFYVYPNLNTPVRRPQKVSSLIDNFSSSKLLLCWEFRSHSTIIQRAAATGMLILCPCVTL